MCRVLDIPNLEMSPQSETITSPFDRLNAVLQRWFYKPDLQAIRIALGTMQAHYLNIGDPAWLFVVAPPGAGKSTMSIMSAAELPQVIALGAFTENTFLSGKYNCRQPGLLEGLGEQVKEGRVRLTKGDAIFLMKDFTTVLSMRRETKAVILSQLREIHDGEFRRDFGTGESKLWHGRVSIIAAVTPVLDRHYSIFSTLGERFLQLRWHRPDSEVAGERAIEQQGQEEQIRREVREAIGGIFGDSCTSSPYLSEHDTHRIACLAEVVAIGRTHVDRNPYSRLIEYVPEPEANTRISKGLAAIAKGVASLNRHEMVAEEDLQDAFRVGMDCLPQTRQQILLAALQGQSIDSVQISRSARDRVVEEMRELGVLEDNLPLRPTERVLRLLAEGGVDACPGASRGGDVE